MKNEEILDEKRKFYSLKSISIATFFGGPIAAGFLMRRNFLNLEEDNKAINSLLLGIFSTIIIFVIIFSLPESVVDTIPNYLIPAIYTGVVSLIADKYQGQKLAEHKENNGAFFSVWRGLGIGLIFTIIIVLVGLGYIYATNEVHNFDDKLYETKIEQFIQNEEIANEVFDKFDYLNDELLIEEFKIGKKLWEDNYYITNELKEIKNLPSEIIDLVESLQKYSSLRIELDGLFIKAFSEQSDEYDSEIERISLKIDQILKKLE